MDDNYLVKSIELLQNKKTGLGFNRIPKDFKLKKELAQKLEEISSLNKKMNEMKNDYESQLTIQNKKINDLTKEKEELNNSVQTETRKKLLKNANITEIVSKNDDVFTQIFNEYLTMKEYINKNIKL